MNTKILSVSNCLSAASTAPTTPIKTTQNEFDLGASSKSINEPMKLKPSQTPRQTQTHTLMDLLSPEAKIKPTPFKEQEYSQVPVSLFGLFEQQTEIQNPQQTTRGQNHEEPKTIGENVESFLKNKNTSDLLNYIDRLEPLELKQSVTQIVQFYIDLLNKNKISSLNDVRIGTQSLLYLVASSNLVDHVKVLKDADYDLNDDYGKQISNSKRIVIETESSLFIAAKKGFYEVISQLSENGYYFSHDDGLRQEAPSNKNHVLIISSLYIASKHNHSKSIRNLLTGGLDLEADQGLEIKDNHKVIAKTHSLYVACEHNSKEAVEIIVKKGNEIRDYFNKFNGFPCKEYVDKSQNTIKISCLYITAERNHSEILDSLLSTKIDIAHETGREVINKAGRYVMRTSTLYAASKENAHLIVEKLIENNKITVQTDIGIETFDNQERIESRQSCLSIAVQKQFTETIKILGKNKLALRTDFGREDYGNGQLRVKMSSLYIAAESNSSQSIETMVNIGIDLKEDQGFEQYHASKKISLKVSSLYIAAAKGSRSSIKLLVAHSFNLSRDRGLEEFDELGNKVERESSLFVIAKNAKFEDTISLMVDNEHTYKQDVGREWFGPNETVIRRTSSLYVMVLNNWSEGVAILLAKGMKPADDFGSEKTDERGNFNRESCIYAACEADFDYILDAMNTNKFNLEKDFGKEEKNNRGIVITRETSLHKAHSSNSTKILKKMEAFSIDIRKDTGLQKFDDLGGLLSQETIHLPKRI
ncbi:hypothetical protein HOG98_03690 [bacterium]|jgi:hypothetical protein|nr:hypothetical protein [bacterium]